MRYLDSKWYFIICAAVMIFFILKSFKTARLYNSSYAAETRRKAYWLIAALGLTGFLIINGKILGSMDEYGLFSDGTTLTYGKETASRIEAAKNGMSGDYSSRAELDDTDHEDDSHLTAAPVWQREDEPTPEDTDLAFSLTSLTEVSSDWTKIKPEGVKSSHSLNKYPAQMVIDGDTLTSWQVEVKNPEKYNLEEEESEWLYFGFGSEKTIDYIVIYNGTPDSEERFNNNGRARGIRFSDLTVDQQDPSEFIWSEPLELSDGRGCRIIECRNLSTKELYMVIDTMYIGGKYTELCIADVEFYSK